MSLPANAVSWQVTLSCSSQPYFRNGTQIGYSLGCSECPSLTRQRERKLTALSFPHSYVPVNVDYGDLWDIMAFFKGDLEGQGGHDHLAEQIATQGKEWTKQFWRWEDMQACEGSLVTLCLSVTLTMLVSTQIFSV